MARTLVVTNPFGDFARGDRITDQAEIDATLAGPNFHHVIVSNHADLDPAPVESRNAASADSAS
jgi:hypothetical protein